MKILTINAGSSSMKFSVIELPEAKELISGYFQRIGIDNSFYDVKINGEKLHRDMDLPNHLVALEAIKKEIVELGVVLSLDEIDGIGHRLVHGGEKYKSSVLIDDEVITTCKKFEKLAKLHMPAMLSCIEASKQAFPNTPMVAVFDTSFHQTMEPKNYLYAVPMDWYKNYGVRKYGFHGTSHKYVANRAMEILNNDDAKLITCHIGNGASISAVKAGKCVDTSMGLTPNAGLMMGTRCGDIDASIVSYICESANLSVEEVNTKLNKESGLLGISGVSSDSRDIEDGIADGDERCELAQDMSVKKIVDYIAQYYVELGGCDAIIFTAGLGENSIITRKKVLEKLAVLGVKLDEERNNVRGKEQLITADNSKIPAYVIPTNEELMIAIDTYNLAK